MHGGEEFLPRDLRGDSEEMYTWARTSQSSALPYFVNKGQIRRAYGEDGFSHSPSPCHVFYGENGAPEPLISSPPGGGPSELSAGCGQAE